MKSLQKWIQWMSVELGSLLFNSTWHVLKKLNLDLCNLTGVDIEALGVSQRRTDYDKMRV